MLRFAPLLASLALAGCYLSHGRGDAEPPVDAGAPVDSGPRADAGPPVDAGLRPDAGSACGSVVVGDTRLVSSPGTILTPRLFAIPGGDVGLVYVSSGGGDPVRVVYERLGPDLEPRAEPATLTDQSWTWAEPAVVGDRFYLAHGNTSGPSRLRPYDFDGAPLGPGASVELFHPDQLEPAAGGLLWVAFEAETGGNRLTAALLGLDGAPLRPALVATTGPFGSGHSAAAQGPDDPAPVLGYTAEGSGGSQQGFLTAVDAGGAPPRPLGTEGDVAVYPVFVGGRLVITRHHGDGLALEPTDPRTLERLGRFEHPAMSGMGAPAAVGPRLVLASLFGGQLVVDDFGEDLATVEQLRADEPGLPATVGADRVSLPGAAVYAFGVISGRSGQVFLTRIQCGP